MMKGVQYFDQEGRCKIFSVENGLPVNNMITVFEDKEHIMWFVNEQT